SLIDDEDVINSSFVFIRQNDGKTTLKDYQNFINSVLFPQMEIAIDKKITVKTSQI
ncbi:19074_t:CDS:1, partial [Funneliformis geosporum]